MCKNFFNWLGERRYLVLNVHVLYIKAFISMMDHLRNI